jgi:dihydrofolate synthase/folylpolyglutamate synthase
VAFELFKRSLVVSDPTRSKVFKQALANVKWPGRFEVIEAPPRFILDCAHNLEATLALVESLHLKRERPSVLVFGALQKKPAHEMLKLLRPLVNHVILVSPPISRALPPGRLSEKGDHVEESMERGLATAFRLAKPNETVLVTGSLFTIAAVRARLLGERTDPPIGL